MLTFYGLDYTYYDHPNQYSLVLYCSGCNFSCYGCHNRTLAGWNYKDSKKAQKTKVESCNYNPKLSDDEIRMAIQNQLIDMVILCGGELLIYSVDQIKQTIDQIKKRNPNVLIRIDTNGSFPDKVKELAKWGGMDGFAIDIKGPYWNKNFHEKTSEVIGLPYEYSLKLFPKLVESLEISKEFDQSIYRTVLYPIVENKEYFDEIKKYVANNLKRPHSFNNFVDL